MIGVVNIAYTDIQKRIKKRKKRFRVFLILLILSVLIIYVLTTPVFKVNEIIVSGNNIVPAEKIITLSGINKGDNLLKLNMGMITDNILTNPYIEACDVKRSFFGSVYISVGERENAGITRYKDKYLAMDKNGAVIEILDSTDGLNLPLISGLNIKNAVPGKVIELSDSRQLNVIKIVFDSITSCDLSDIINEVDISNLISILVKTKLDIIIKIGSVDKINDKLKIAKAIIEQDLSKKGLKGNLDLSFDGNPIFKQE